MHIPAFFEPVDYLVIGHISRDLSSMGIRIGGTASYAALTAQSLGLKVGIVTAWGEDVPLGLLQDIPIAGIVSKQSTTFENLETVRGRIQILHHLAPVIDYQMIPDAWRDAPIIHLGPVAQEISPTIIHHFSDSFIGITAQGWLRNWDTDGHIHACEWTDARIVLKRASAVIISTEDISNDPQKACELASFTKLLAVTQGSDGANIYYKRMMRNIASPLSKNVDSVGSGDIFSAAFFTHFHKYQNPWKAANFANRLASASVSKIGIASAVIENQEQFATTKA